MRRVTAVLTLFAAGLALPPTVLAVSEVEDNSSFATRMLLAPGTSEITGETTLDLDFDLTDTGTLTPGGVVGFSFPGFSPGEPFYAFVDNSASGADLTLGSDGLGGLVTDDDSSPLGDGLAPALVGDADVAGAINLSVSGFPDFDFDGLADGSSDAHSESGDFTLFVSLDLPEHDVDYFGLTGLTPGGVYVIEVLDADFDTTLGVFDAAGSLTDFDDDGGLDLLSRIDSVAAPDGTINFAISGFPDFEFDGFFAGSFGAYRIGVRPIPEPAAGLLLLAAAPLLSRMRKRG